MSDAIGQSPPPGAPETAPVEPRITRGQPIPDGSVTPLVHYYRAEVSRGDVWRVRMDATTNWAIGTAAALISVAFSRPEIPHLLLPLGGLIVLLLLCIEGRRYRFYDVWRSRTRLMEAHMIVPFLLPETALLQGRWREQLAEDLLLPSYKMSFWRAAGARLRRNYLWIFITLLFCWIVRVMMITRPGGQERVFQGEVTTFAEFYDALRFGPVPGWVFLVMTGLFYGALLVWAFGAGHVGDPDALVYKRMPNRKSAWPT